MSQNGLIALCSLFCLSTFISTASGQDVQGPLQPRDSLSQFVLHPDCQIELAAAEPQVIDPVAIQFDAKGRMWVVEMRDYPLGPPEGEKPQSRIRILEDRDQDGFFETSQLFADELSFPTGIQLWRDGAIVTLSGSVVWLRDTDGDLRADQSEVWFSGFTEENTQLRANHPTLGIDGRIYVANGLRGGTVLNQRHKQEPIAINGMDFAFDPHTGLGEPVSGVGQFGLTFDLQGNRFVCSNRNPVKQIVIEHRYVEKATQTRLPAVAHDAALSAEASRVYPISQAWTTSNLHAGQFTAACGVTIFNGTALSAEFTGNAFTCEPTGNLVHLEVFQPVEGPALQSTAGRDQIEFLASRDTWFRPVNLANGPDGSLYVVDMYRAVIEHPQFMPDELKQRPDLLLGKDRGRIYRIRKKDGPNKITTVDFSNLDQCIAALEHPNLWHAETAMRRMLEEQTALAASEPLVKLLKKIAAESAVGIARVRANWLLESIGLTDEELLVRALHDEDPLVRRHALLISERHVTAWPSLKTHMLELANDENATVRFQLLLSNLIVGEKLSIESLARIFKQSPADIWICDAVLMNCEQCSGELIQSLVDDQAWMQSDAAGDAQWKMLFDQFALSRDFAAAAKIIHQLLATFGNASDAHADRLERLVVDLVGALQQRGASGPQIRELIDGSADTQAASAFSQWLESIAKRAIDTKVESTRRVRSIQIVSFFNPDSPLAATLTARDQHPLVRQTAIASLGKTSDRWRDLLQGFAAESPEIRRAIMDAALQHAEISLQVLQAIAEGQINVREIDRSTRDRFLKSGNAEVKTRAGDLLGSTIQNDRAVVLQQYMSACESPGDANRGKLLFQKNCSACHRFGELGNNVGPDISDTRVKTKQQLLMDIIDPNGAIDANFISYTLTTLDGKSYAGVIAEENASTVILKMAESKTVELLRSDIDELASTGLSLMPEGFEKDLSVAEMADLLSYLKNWRYLEANVPFVE
jgi:putative membrane-bound dehydrogenase-like protein